MSTISECQSELFYYYSFMSNAKPRNTMSEPANLNRPSFEYIPCNFSETERECEEEFKEYVKVFPLTKENLKIHNTLWVVKSGDEQDPGMCDYDSLLDYDENSNYFGDEDDSESDEQLPSKSSEKCKHSDLGMTIDGIVCRSCGKEFGMDEPIISVEEQKKKMKECDHDCIIYSNFNKVCVDCGHQSSLDYSEKKVFT